MRKTAISCIVAILLIVLCACVKQEVIYMETVPENSNIADLNVTKYSDSQLHDIIENYDSVEKLDAKFPVELIRQTGSLYRVVYCSESKYAILYFSENGTKEYGRIFSMSSQKASFDTLIGKSVTDVQLHDPFGDYSFLYTGRNDLKSSEHYTQDGFLVHVYYDDSCIVDSITSELLWDKGEKGTVCVNPFKKQP